MTDELRLDFNFGAGTSNRTLVSDAKGCKFESYSGKYSYTCKGRARMACSHTRHDTRVFRRSTRGGFLTEAKIRAAPRLERGRSAIGW